MSVGRVGATNVMPMRARSNGADDLRGPRSGGQVKNDLTIRAALEWAFATEHAELEFPEEWQARAGRGPSMESVLLERARLGGVSIDTSRGRSYPHDDADRIADVVARLPGYLGGRGMAVFVAQYARARCTPDWLQGASPSFEPAEWINGPHGSRGKTERAGFYIETKRVPHPKNPRRKIKRTKRHEIRYTPVRMLVTPQQIEAARAHYLAWWQALEYLNGQLPVSDLRSVRILGPMPPERPWDLPR
jgi:hypothetical protein